MGQTFIFPLNIDQPVGLSGKASSSNDFPVGGLGLFFEDTDRAILAATHRTV